MSVRTGENTSESLPTAVTPNARSTVSIATPPRRSIARWPSSSMVPQLVVSVSVYPDGRVSFDAKSESGKRSDPEAEAVSAARCAPETGVSGGSFGSGLAQLTSRDRMSTPIRGARQMIIVACNDS